MQKPSGAADKVPAGSAGPGVLAHWEVAFLGWPSLLLGVVPLVSPSSVARLIGVRSGRRTHTVLRMLGVRELVVAVVFLRQRTSPYLWAFVAQDVMDLPFCTAIAWARRPTNPRHFTVAYVAYLAMAAVDVHYAMTRNAGSRLEPAP